MTYSSQHVKNYPFVSSIQVMTRSDPVGNKYSKSNNESQVEIEVPVEKNPQDTKSWYHDLRKARSEEKALQAALRLLNQEESALEERKDALLDESDHRIKIIGDRISDIVVEHGKAHLTQEMQKYWESEVNAGEETVQARPSEAGKEESNPLLRQWREECGLRSALAELFSQMKNFYMKAQQDREYESKASAQFEEQERKLDQRIRELQKSISESTRSESHMKAVHELSVLRKKEADRTLRSTTEELTTLVQNTNKRYEEIEREKWGVEAAIRRQQKQIQGLTETQRKLKAKVEAIFRDGVKSERPTADFQAVLTDRDARKSQSVRRQSRISYHARKVNIDYSDEGLTANQEGNSGASNASEDQVHAERSSSSSLATISDNFEIDGLPAASSPQGFKSSRKKADINFGYLRSTRSTVNRKRGSVPTTKQFKDPVKSSMVFSGGAAKSKNSAQAKEEHVSPRQMDRQNHSELSFLLEAYRGAILDTIPQSRTPVDSPIQAYTNTPISTRGSIQPSSPAHFSTETTASDANFSASPLWLVREDLSSTSSDQIRARRKLNRRPTPPNLPRNSGGGGDGLKQVKPWM